MEGWLRKLTFGGITRPFALIPGCHFSAKPPAKHPEWWEIPGWGFILTPCPLKSHPAPRANTSGCCWEELGPPGKRRGAADLEEDLQEAVQDAHAAAQQEEEGHHQLHKVVDQGLEAVEPPGRAVHEVRDGAGHRLRLQQRGKMELIPSSGIKCSGDGSFCVWIQMFIDSYPQYYLEL